MFIKSLCWSLVPPWQRSIVGILSLTVIRMTGSWLELLLQVPLTLWRRGAKGMFLMCYSLQSHHHHFICYAGWYTSKIFRSLEKYYLQKVWSLYGLKVTIFSIINPLSRKRWMSYWPRVPLNNWLVMLAFTHIYLWFPGILVFMIHA